MRVKFLMEYNPKNTIHENLLKEQLGPDLIELPNRMFGLGGYNAKDFWRGQTLIPATPWSDTKTLGDLIDWTETWNISDWATFAEIAFTVGSIFTGPFAPAMLSVAASIGIANGADQIVSGKDPYNGGLMIAFTIIGMDWWNKILNPKYTKTLFEMGGPKEAVKLLKVVESGSATSKQKKLAEKMISELAPVSEEIAKKTLSETFKLWIKSLGKMSLKTILTIILCAGKLGIELSKLGLVIGGVFYTFDIIYLALTHEKSESREIRNNNSLAVLKDKVLGNEEQYKIQMIGILESQLENLNDDQKSKIMMIDTAKVTSYIDSEIKKIESQFISKNQKQSTSTSPTFDEVLRKKQNPETKTPYVFKEGLYGEDIKKIQIMLSQIEDEYKDVLTGFGSYSNFADGKFGEYTKEAIELFQKDNNLKSDGILDDVSLNTLIKLAKNKK